MASLEFAVEYFQSILSLSKELLEQETRLALQLIYDGVLPLPEFPVSKSSPKRRKRSSQGRVHGQTDLPWEGRLRHSGKKLAGGPSPPGVVTLGDLSDSMSSVKRRKGTNKYWKETSATEDLGRENVTSAEQGGIHDRTSLPSEGPVHAEHSEERFSIALPPVEDVADNGSKSSPVENGKDLIVSAPANGRELVERESDTAVQWPAETEDGNAHRTANGRELVERESNTAVQWPAETEDGNADRTANGRELVERESDTAVQWPAETEDGNADRTQRTVACSAGVRCPEEELEKKESAIDAIGAAFGDLPSSAMNQVRNENAEIRQERTLESDDNSLEASAFCRYLDCDVGMPSKEIDRGQICSSPEPALERMEVHDLGRDEFLPDNPPGEDVTHRDSAASQVKNDIQASRSTGTPQIQQDEPVVLEIGTIVPDIPQLKRNGGDRLGEMGEIGATSSSPEQSHGEAVLTVSVHAVEVQGCMERGSDCLEDSDLLGGNILPDHLSDKESSVKAGKEPTPTTASPQCHGEFIFEREGRASATVTNSSSMDMDDEIDLPTKAAENVPLDQVHERRGSAGECDVKEKVVPELRRSSGVEVVGTVTNMFSTPCALGNVGAQFDGEHVKDDAMRATQASNGKDLVSREDAVLTNSSHVSRSNTQLQKFAHVSMSKMMAHVLASGKSTHKQVRKLDVFLRGQNGTVDGEDTYSPLHVGAKEHGPLVCRFDELYGSDLVRKNAACGSTIIDKDMSGPSPRCAPSVTARSSLCREPEVVEISEIGSATDCKSHRVDYTTSITAQGWNTINPPLLLVQDGHPQEAETPDRHPQIVKECFQIVNNVCQVSAERGGRVPIKYVSFSRGEQVLTVSSIGQSSEDGGVLPLDPSATPIRCANSPQPSVSSDIGNPQDLTSNLISVMKSLVPVIQRPPPVFLPNGKREVKVKALDAARALKSMQELKERQRKMVKGSDENAGCAVKQGRANEEAVLSDCSNSLRLHSSFAKSKQLTASRMEKKVKKHEEEIRRKEEEMKRKDAKFLAWRQNKEQQAKTEREMKRQKQDGFLRQRKGEGDQLHAELEDTEQKHRGVEESERERKVTAEIDTRQAELRAGHKRRKVMDQKEQKIGAGLLRAARSTVHGPGQQSSDSSQPRSGPSLLSRSAVRVHSVSVDKRTNVVVVPDSHMDSGVSCLETPSPEAVEREDIGPTSYEMSPYKESSDDEDQEQFTKIEKHIPFWARKDNLKRQLLKQLLLDPDEIFGGAKTCSLKDVFGTTGSKKIQDFCKRSGSGDWVKDRVSWKEELQYKIQMGYMRKKYP